MVTFNKPPYIGMATNFLAMCSKKTPEPARDACNMVWLTYYTTLPIRILKSFGAGRNALGQAQRF